MNPSVPEWIVNQLPSGSFSPAGISSQPCGLYGATTPSFFAWMPNVTP